VPSGRTSALSQSPTANPQATSKPQLHRPAFCSACIANPLEGDVKALPKQLLRAALFLDNKKIQNVSGEAADCETE